MWQANAQLKQTIRQSKYTLGKPLVRERQNKLVLLQKHADSIIISAGLSRPLDG